MSQKWQNPAADLSQTFSVNEINLQRCMNYMISTYNETLFTIDAAKFSATAAVAAPTEKAAEAAQRLTKIRQRFH